MASATTDTAPTARLKTRYLEEIRPALIERFGYSSVMQAPKLEKVTVNMGVGLAKQDSKMLKAATEQLAAIAGQQPSPRSNYARACPSGWRSRCAASAATSSSTV
jgi:large subunit ribosomal protein L5